MALHCHSRGVEKEFFLPHCEDDENVSGTHFALLSGLKKVKLLSAGLPLSQVLLAEVVNE